MTLAEAAAILRRWRGHASDHPVPAAEAIAVVDALAPTLGSGIMDLGGPPAPPREAGFDRFWKAYPRKVAKPAALRAYRKLVAGNEVLLGLILADVAKRRASDEWTKDEGAFIPYPASYLNGRRWEDAEPEVARATSGYRRV